MTKSYLFLVSALCALWAAAAFTPSPTGFTIKTARRVPGLKPTHLKQTILRMSDESPSEEAEKSASETQVAPAKGEAFYDDEVRIPVDDAL